MPTEVHHPVPVASEHLHHHEHPPHHHNANAQHRDALRLALGSILTPKRPSPSRTHSGSGSTSGYATPSGASPHPQPQPDGPPADTQHLQVPYHHFQHHSHPPSRLAETCGTGEQPTGQHLAPPQAPELPRRASADDVHEETARPNSASRAKFIETLQSKKAWDALIHGSFS